jgi:predicted N-formylglutamate amidohydrolase
VERRRTRSLSSPARFPALKADVPDVFLFTCEHGGNRIPAAYRHFFAEQQAWLDSHRGYDHGALRMAGALARAFQGRQVSATVSRLLVDLNRSIGHPQLFSEGIRALPLAVKNTLIAQFYAPYRRRVERFVSQAVANGQRVIHISSHSFTPVLGGVVRNADVGLLYDPARRSEAELCARWKTSLGGLVPELRVRRNYPYAGKNDGLTACLRRHFTPEAYVGIELEINQSMLISTGRRVTKLQAVLIESLRVACIRSAAVSVPATQHASGQVLVHDDQDHDAAQLTQ